MIRKTAAALGVASLIAIGAAAGANATPDAQGYAVPDQPSVSFASCSAPIPGDISASRPADTIDIAYREQDGKPTSDVPQWARDAWPGYNGTWWVTYGILKGKYKWAADTGVGWDQATIYDPNYGNISTQTYWVPDQNPACL